MELVVVKVRPSYGDKKMHVLRFLFPSEFFSLGLVKVKLRDLFPYGFYNPTIDRYKIDYSFDLVDDKLVPLCNHDYLSKYLNSEKKIE